MRVFVSLESLRLLSTNISKLFNSSKNSWLLLLEASALVLIYTDGSVLVSHGGMEMGQGLHTKIIQVNAFYHL